MAKPARIFISVAEDSADAHAAALVRAAGELLPACSFYGLTGPRLRALGVETVFDFASHAAMLGGVVSVLGRAWKALRAVERCWRAQRPDLVVLLDLPELNLKLARRAKRLGLPVLYYVAPQTWAARAYRNRQIVRDVDRLACILPFEEGYFRRIAHQSVKVEQAATTAAHPPFRAEYVGHPLFETLRHERAVPGTIEFLKLRAAGRHVVALLPGSRRHVIDAMLPKQLEVIRRLRAAGREVYAAISCVSDDRREQIRGILAVSGLGQSRGCEGADRRDSPAPTESCDAGVDMVVADNASLLTAADLVLVASGTATLHVAYYRKPMIVMYDAGRMLRLPYRLFGRLVIRMPHSSLVNILAQARVVPEFMPFVHDLGTVATVAGQLLTDAVWRKLMVAQLDALVRPLEDSQASKNVCRIIGGLLGDQRCRVDPLWPT